MENENNPEDQTLENLFFDKFLEMVSSMVLTNSQLVNCTSTILAVICEKLMLDEKHFKVILEHSMQSFLFIKKQKEIEREIEGQLKNEDK